MADVTTNHAIGDDRDQREGYVRNVTVAATVSATQSATDVIRMLRIPSNARVQSIRVTSDLVATTGQIDIGLYEFNEEGDGAVIDVDFFNGATPVDLGTITNKVDPATGIAPLGNLALDQSQALWEAIGVAADPGGYYVIAATVTEVFLAAGTVLTFDVMYTL